jgi:hypothetical protein
VPRGAPNAAQAAFEFSRISCFLSINPHIVDTLYRAYGLSISSNIPILGLLTDPASRERTDLKLEIGAEPEWVSRALRLPSFCYHQLPAEPLTEDPAFIVTALGAMEFFALTYTDGTSFVVDAAGTKVWGTWTPPLVLEDLVTYLLGPVMGFVLRRRGVTPLHASAVSFGGRAIVLTGAAQAGKSTTAAALALLGVPVLCEDVAALKESTTGFSVEAGYPRVCVWPDTVQKLLGEEDALPRLTPNWEKRFLALDGVRAKFEADRLPLGAVYLFAPRTAQSDAPRVEELGPREALLELVQNTYMNWLLDRKQRAEEFDLLARLAARVPVRRIVPHQDATRLGMMCELLLADASRVCAEGRAEAEVPGD